ncbi:hypothetical protein DIPPA_13381 [Diplonema papillatum]|nr:hypothetical protein DIPPA_13381 [Diplonema papillatum]
MRVCRVTPEKRGPGGEREASQQRRLKRQRERDEGKGSNPAAGTAAPLPGGRPSHPHQKLLDALSEADGIVSGEFRDLLHRRESVGRDLIVAGEEDGRREVAWCAATEEPKGLDPGGSCRRPGCGEGAGEEVSVVELMATCDFLVTRETIRQRMLSKQHDGSARLLLEGEAAAREALSHAEQRGHGKLTLRVLTFTTAVELLLSDEAEGNPALPAHSVAELLFSESARKQQQQQGSSSKAGSSRSKTAGRQQQQGSSSKAAAARQQQQGSSSKAAAARQQQQGSSSKAAAARQQQQGSSSKAAAARQQRQGRQHHDSSGKAASARQQQQGSSSSKAAAARQQQQGSSSNKAAAARQQQKQDSCGKTPAAAARQQRQVGSGTTAAARRQGSSGKAAAEARQQWQGGSGTIAAARRQRHDSSGKAASLRQPR